MKRKFKLIVWGIVATVAAVIAHIINPITSAIVNCPGGPAYFNFQLFMCSSWPGFIIGFQFVTASVLLGPRNRIFYLCLVIPFAYICALELMRTGLLKPYDVLGILGMVLLTHKDEIYGAIVATMSIYLFFTVAGRSRVEKNT